LKEEIEKYIKSDANNINMNKNYIKNSEIFLEKYQEKFKEISDHIININSNYIDQEFKQNFFRKYLFYDKMLLRPKIEILLKNIEVKK